MTKSLRTHPDDVKTITKLLSWLNTKIDDIDVSADDPEERRRSKELLEQAFLGDAVGDLIACLNGLTAWRGDPTGEPLREAVNKRLVHCRFFPQLDRTEKGVVWLVDPDAGEDKRRYDIAVQEILSLYDRGLLFRLRLCMDGRLRPFADESCDTWFYADRNRKKLFHSKRCQNRAAYAALTPEEKKKSNKKAKRRMRKQRKKAKELALKMLKLSRTGRK
jgi:hypothetical protein